MLRNSTKLTSLVVAAATVASMTPAFAADIARATDYDGKVYNAVVYKNGAYYIDGELEDMDEDAYYAANGKYTGLEDVDSGDSAKLYGGKYVEIEEGDNYLDLSTGKVTDDDVREDAYDDAASNLRKKVKKDDPSDRYNDTDNLVNYDSDNDVVEPGVNAQVKDTLYSVPGAKFSEPYYVALYTAKAGYKSNAGGGDGIFTVYTDKAGNYIDADYNLGKVSFKTTTGENATLKNTDDDDAGCKVTITHIKTIGSDKDNVYRLAALRVVSKDNGENLTEQVEFKNDVKGTNVTTTEAAGYTSSDKFILVLQKISKAQASDDIDDAKYAKTANTYFLTGDDGAKKDDKFACAYDEDTAFTVVDGKVIAYYKKDSAKVQAYAYTLKSKNGYYYTDASDGSDCDTENPESENSAQFKGLTVTTGADGKLYALDGGYVKVFDNDEDWDKVAKVDGSATDFSVYDKDNMIAWNEDDEAYSILAGKAASTEETEDTTTTAQAGWVQNADSTWSYINADGTKAIGWLQSPTSGLWYYMDANGIMETNKWVQDGGKWFFVTESGAMKTGWLYNGGAWDYLNTISGQKGGLGCMQTGWVLTGGKWYYCNASGAMLANTTVNGYVLGADGAWIK